ncbi:cytochrome b5 reductase 4-like isoform 1 [Cricetulus griseus]|nr:cytochrome b5 reductase 4-like isoform 1 [Cricetulus griseus]
MLKKCCWLPGQPLNCHEGKRVLNGMRPKSQVTDTLPREGPSSPSYDWFQTESSVTIVIYTKQKNINLDSVIVDLQDDSLRAEVVIKDQSYLIHIVSVNLLFFSVRVIENVGKVDIVLQKRENIPWKCLGQPLEKHDSFIPKKDTGLYYRKCQLISKEYVTHDTRLFCLMLPPSTHLQVPVGHHVYLMLSVTGDFVSVSSPEGNFKLSKLQEVEDLFLLAAGTGFTPMVNILKYSLTSVSSLRKVKLMFFNKTEDDIIWRCQLEKLAFKDKRFDIEFVLSTPSSEWNGKRGHVSPALLSEFLERSLENSRVFLCICGPTPFTDEGIRLLHDLNFSTDEIHGFTA